ncbi:MAG: HAMP domain-containing histidine kinase [Dysgonamonadaceae bacterium]|jgi:two-component system phosphate regulon sensor histidine kinase PhoR|nr:HAMP domain-containing histidine kinase [Dysgonamonadaceae bacterium]
MKNNYIKLITSVALVAIFVLQGMWLYNTYTLLETEFNKNLSSIFISSIEKEAYNRMDNPVRKKTLEHKIIDGYSVENNRYTNIKALQDFLYSDEFPLSMEELDTILSEDMKNLKIQNYSLSVVDSLGNESRCINHGKVGISPYIEKMQLRSVNPQYAVLTVSSPYKIIFKKMLLLLIGSLILAIAIGYCIFLQIKIIIRQDRIAEIRQDFTYAMIHDMKNPITAILMGINTLKSGKIDSKPEMKVQFYKAISKEGEHILTITNKILTIAQFEEKKIILSKRLIDLTELIDNLTEKYELDTSKEILFHVELNAVKNIYADYEYIYESFSNIIDNAVKYSEEKVNIYITSIAKDKFIQIKFKDDGIGISVKDQKKVFDKFERASAVQKEQKASGFGLGLNYVYQVITAHGGKIELNSELGSYSEFIINLPYNDKIITD